MKNGRKLILLLILAVTTNSCFVSSAWARIPMPFAPIAVYPNFPETFESGVKPAYAFDTVTLSSGDWTFDNALIGNSASDKKDGSWSVRIQNTGKITMLFDIASGSSKISVQHAIYGSDAPSSWGLWYSIDGGSSWIQAGSDIVTTSASLQQTTFAVSLYGNMRFEIRKNGGGRLNIDNISITDNTGTCCCGCAGGLSDTIPTQDDNMAMGNPSIATSNPTDSNNYLMVKHQFALSYNNSKGMANWVSWHLSLAWKGSADRCDCFSQDAALPTGYYKAATGHYTGSGFDRGHFCPSDDRDLSDSDNAATFKMTNISPQAPFMNQDTWGDLEDYCRSLITEGNELYIIAGAYGSGGSGSLGGITFNINSGTIKVPSNYWKVVVVLPVGASDVSRVTSGTRVIAVNMPNTQSVNAQPWGFYRTTTDAIESLTGYNLLSNVPDIIQTAIESTVDTGPTF
jgi:endonuclease G